MTEDKATKALRKVIINFIPDEQFGRPCTQNDYLSIDVSDKFQNPKLYHLYNVVVNYDGYSNKIDYMSFESYSQFKKSVENILDATIVNTKQRQSIQHLLDQAFYDWTKHDSVV